MIDFEKLRQKRNNSNLFAKNNGIETTLIREGYAECEIADCTAMRNPFGTIHGGLIYTLADVAAGSAACSHGRWAVTLNANIEYLHAVKNAASLLARATELKYGKNVSVYRVEILQDEKVMASGTFTMFCLDKSIEL